MGELLDILVWLQYGEHRFPEEMFVKLFARTDMGKILSYSLYVGYCEKKNKVNSDNVKIMKQ